MYVYVYCRHCAEYLFIIMSPLVNHSHFMEDSDSIAVVVVEMFAYNMWGGSIEIFNYFIFMLCVIFFFVCSFLFSRCTNDKRIMFRKIYSPTNLKRDAPTKTQNDVIIVGATLWLLASISYRPGTKMNIGQFAFGKYRQTSTHNKKTYRRMEEKYSIEWRIEEKKFVLSTIGINFTFSSAHNSMEWW